jgi:ankyrin repeat protein
MINKIFAYIVGTALITFPIMGMEKQVRIVSRTDQFKYARAKDLESIKAVADIINLNLQEETTGQTMLHYSVMLKDYPTIRFLLETGRIDTEIKNSSGRTVRDLAINAGLKDIKKLLEDYREKKIRLQ